MLAAFSSRRRVFMAYQGIIHNYREYMPVTDETPIITLLEGNTPLIPAVNIPSLIGLDAKLYFKYEGLNPTGSFKDRGMCMAVSKALEEKLGRFLQPLILKNETLTKLIFKKIF